MLDIVIVNWNAGPLLRDCIDSLLEHGGDAVSHIIVVDNGSTDGSADAVDGVLGVNILRTGDNLGFAAACNIGAAKGGSPYILFLNPDTRIGEGSLSIPLTFMDRSENYGVGICGIQLVNEEGEIGASCSRFPSIGRLVASVLGIDRLPGFQGFGMRMADWNHEDAMQVDQVMGAFFLIRRAVFDACMGFDERFFVYFEEVDLSWRSKQLGCKSWFLPDAQIFHAGGGTSRQIKAKRLFYSLRSRLLYGFKHFSWWQAWLLVFVTGVVEPYTRTAWCVLRGDWSGVHQTWSAYWMLWCGMGKIIHGEGRFEP
jgi:GT2 family glycosyltransferase